MNSKSTIFFFIFLASLGLHAQTAKVGNIAAVNGVVLLDGKPAKNGMPLMPKSTVRTKAGTCTLLFGTDVVVHLDKNSNFLVENYKAQAGKTEMGVKLRFGRLRALAANKKDTDKDIQIKTRTAVMGIRGTHVYVDSPANPKLPVNFLTIEGVATVTLDTTKPPPAPGQTLAQNEEGDGKADQKPEQKSEQKDSKDGDKADKAEKGDTQKADKSESSTEGKKAEGGDVKGEKGQMAASGSTSSSNRGPASSGGSMGGTAPKGPGVPGGTAGPPPPGRGPGGAPAGGPVILAANQMLASTGDVKPVDPSVAMGMAHSVAPPPPPIQNTKDVAGTVSGNPPPPPPPPGGGPNSGMPGDLLDTMLPPPPPQIPFDPVADGSQFVPLTIQFQ